MKQEYLGFSLVALALIGGLLIAKSAGPLPLDPPALALGSTNQGAISVDAAWVAETIGGQSRTAAYLSIHNGSGGEERLLGVSSDAATHVSIHMTRTEDNVSSMQAVDALILQPSTTTQLAPGGLHIMVMGLNAPLETGGSILLTLEFLEAGDVALEVPVMSRATMLDRGPH